MLEIKSVAASVGSFRLKDVDLSIGAGECHALLGPSGAGKSTLLQAVLGALPVTDGRVWLDGAEITNLPVEKRKIGYVPQHLGLFPHLSVAENLRYSARARKIPREEFVPLLEQLVEITGIGSLVDRRIETLSGGERQRVALVRALTANPGLVLLDEPFTSLNETLRKDLWWLVKDLQRERGLSVLLITHDLTEAYFLAERITVLIDGRLEQSGDKRTIYRRPATLGVARFLGIKNLFRATVATSMEGGFEADCPCLGHRFRLEGSVSLGTKIYLGIRAEDIELWGHGDRMGPNDCKLEGTAELIVMATHLVMRFRAPQLPSIVEVMLPSQFGDRMRVEDESADATILLRQSSIFWVLDRE